DETEKIVADVLIDRGIRLNAWLGALDISSDLLVLALKRRAAADEVDRAMLRGTHEPGAGPLGHARRGPLLERGDQCVLCELFGLREWTVNDGALLSIEANALALRARREAARSEDHPRLDQLLVELLVLRHGLRRRRSRRCRLRAFLCQHKYTHLAPLSWTDR